MKEDGLEKNAPRHYGGAIILTPGKPIPATAAWQDAPSSNRAVQLPDCAGEPYLRRKPCDKSSAGGNALCFKH
jgi:hypothetical protein